MKKLSRRDFVKLSTHTLFGLSGLLGLGGLIRYFSYQSAPAKPTEYDLGQASQFPVGSRTIRDDIPAVIENKEGEFAAHSLVCTHLGCIVGAEKTGFVCPCHGSRYDAQGVVLEGPAQESLQRFRVEKSEDQSLKLFTRE